MTQKQYEDARTIMQFGRLFADAMRRAMKNSGLLDLDFQLTVDVSNETLDESGKTLFGTVTLKQNPMNHDDYLETNMCDFRFDKEGWLTVADPVVKPGRVPPEVRTVETASKIYGAGTTQRKETPPDGLWISRFDDPYPVDGGM